jgi:hypothetical protein
MANELSLKKKMVMGFSLGLFIFSLTKPAFFTADDSSDSMNLSSAGLFFLGWIGFLGSAWESLFWLANPLYFLALYRFARDKGNSIIPSCLSWIIAVGFSFQGTFIKNEGGARTEITGMGRGYIFWLASISTLTLGILLFKSTKLVLRKG